ncbi:MAG: hypothetical protein AB8G22_23660 [Saprospiraceae bacterium]
MEYRTMRKLARAKKTLRNALKHILEINKRKFSSAYSETKPEEREAIQTELKILNQIVEQKGKMIQMYEERIKEVG